MKTSPAISTQSHWQENQDRVGTLLPLQARSGPGMRAGAVVINADLLKTWSTGMRQSCFTVLHDTLRMLGVEGQGWLLHHDARGPAGAESSARHRPGQED
jgi:hypothetical protein